MQPDALVIDLKDCSGGGFRPVFALSHGLGVKKDFQFFYDIINEKNRRITGISNFNMLTDTIDINNIWNGKLLIRSNEMCGSGCDFFIRWMKINKRGTLIGTPPEGRGGGYDSFELTHTGTVLNIPLRERIPLGYPNSIEGDVCKPVLITEDSLPDLLRNLNLSKY